MTELLLNGLKDWPILLGITVVLTFVYRSYNMVFQYLSERNSKLEGALHHFATEIGNLREAVIKVRVDSGKYPTHKQ